MDIKYINNMFDAIGKKYEKACNGRKIIEFVEKTDSQIEEETRQFRAEMNHRFSQKTEIKKPRGAVAHQIDYGDFKILAGWATKEELKQTQMAEIVAPKALPPHIEK